MLSSAIPTLVPLPFANSGTKNAIPTASQIGITPGAASLTDGFPPLTFTPIAAGGIPPAGADFNGILNLLSANTQWENAGGFYPYNSVFSTSIGGYPKGAILISSDRTKLWLSTVDNNTVDPDAGASANWFPITTGRLINVQTFTASGTYTPTAGTTSVVVEAIGGGGAGGGCGAASAGQAGGGGGGGGGSYGKGRYTSSFSGVSVTIGAGGTPGSAGANGGAGGTTSFGALLSCPGGNGGTAGTPSSSFPSLLGGSTGGAAPTGANVESGLGFPGGQSFTVASAFGVSGDGANSVKGGGAYHVANATLPGNAATTKGSGGSGSFVIASGSANAGGAGAPGIVIVYEFS